MLIKCHGQGRVELNRSMIENMSMSVISIILAIRTYELFNINYEILQRINRGFVYIMVYLADENAPMSMWNAIYLSLSIYFRKLKK